MLTPVFCYVSIAAGEKLFTMTQCMSESHSLAGGCNVGDVTDFFAPNTFRVHLCDCPLFAGPRDILDGSVYPWREVISVHSFRCLMLLPIHRWRRRKQKKDKHPLGNFLHMIDWKRARLVMQVYLQDVPWS